MSADEERRASWEVIKNMHPMNRLRWMFGLEALPEDQEKISTNTSASEIATSTQTPNPGPSPSSSSGGPVRRGFMPEEAQP